MSIRTIIVQEKSAIEFEADANAAITPGQIVELLSTGKVQKNASAAVDGERMIAIEDTLQGNDIADDYDAGDRVLMRIMGRGDVVHAILADGQDAPIGTKLELATGGELNAYSAGVKMFVALTDVDASDSATTTVANRRIKVRVI